MALTIIILLGLVQILHSYHGPEIIGNVAPPPIYDDCYQMIPFPTDNRADGTLSTSVTSTVSGNPLTFTTAHEILQDVGPLWSGWGYVGGIYHVASSSNGKYETNITVPINTCAFIFYVAPNTFNTSTFTLIFSNGEVIMQDITTPNGSVGFAVSRNDIMGIPIGVKISAPSGSQGTIVGAFSMCACDTDCVCTIDPTADPTTDPTIDPTADPTTDPTIDPTKAPSASSDGDDDSGDDDESGDGVQGAGSGSGSESNENAAAVLVEEIHNEKSYNEKRSGPSIKKYVLSTDPQQIWMFSAMGIIGIGLNCLGVLYYCTCLYLNHGASTSQEYSNDIEQLHDGNEI